MREILFRGQYIDSSDWIYSMTIGKGTVKRKRDCVFMEIQEGFWKQVKPETVGQFTGLLDKNGKKNAFESDVVKYEYWIQTSADPESEGKQFSGEGVIVYIEGAFMVEDIKTKHRIPLHYPDLSIEIVGNIFDKDMLK